MAREASWRWKVGSAAYISEAPLAGEAASSVYSRC